MSNCKMYYTGICGKKAFSFFNDFRTAAKNSYKGSKHWLFCELTPVISASNEVAFEYRGWNSGKMLECDQSFRNYIAWTIKDLVKNRKGNTWSRFSNADFTLGSSIYSVCDAYAIYDFLLGRKNFERNYQADRIKEIFQDAFDPIRTEQETIYREEIARINDEFNKASSKLDDEKYAEIDKIKKEIFAKYDALRVELIKKRDDDLAKVNEEFSQLIEEN